MIYPPGKILDLVLCGLGFSFSPASPGGCRVIVWGAVRDYRKQCDLEIFSAAAAFHVRVPATRLSFSFRGIGDEPSYQTKVWRAHVATCATVSITVVSSSSLIVLALALTMKPADNSSIFEGGRLKPGIYKIQNLYSRGYVDIYEHSKEMRCRSAQDLGEGNARTVRPHPLPIIRV